MRLAWTLCALAPAAVAGPQAPGVVDFTPDLPPTSTWPVFVDQSASIGTPGTKVADDGTGRGQTWADVVGPDPSDPANPALVGPPDGLLDMIQVNSNTPALPLGSGPGQWVTPPIGPTNQKSVVFRANPDGTLTDVTDAMSPYDPEGWNVAYPGGSAWGVIAGDFDDDGDADLFYPCGGFNIATLNTLLRNEGDGTFRNVTALAKISGSRQTFTATWFDYDRDGDLDIYEANSGLELMPYYQGIPDQDPADRLLENQGDSTFVDVAEQADCDLKSNGFSVVAPDLNLDGWSDVVVGCMYQYNKVFYNDGDGTFSFMLPAYHPEAGLSLDQLQPDPAWGDTVDFPFVPETFLQRVPVGGFRSLPADVGDVNGDGWPDVFYSCWSNQMPDANPGGAEGALFLPFERSRLYLNRGDQDGDGRGDGVFREAAIDVGLAHIGGAMGHVLGDYNGDGLLDVYIGGGGPKIPADFEEDYLYVNEPSGWPKSFLADPDQPLGRAFYELGALVGTYGNLYMCHGLNAVPSSGRIDVAVGNGGPALFDLGQKNIYYENTGNADGLPYDLFTVHLVERSTAPGADGTRVELFRAVPPGPGQRVVLEARGGFGFASSNRFPLTFGMGRDRVLFANATWGSGIRQGRLFFQLDPAATDTTFVEPDVSVGVDVRYPVGGGLELSLELGQVGPAPIDAVLWIGSILPQPGGYVWGIQPAPVASVTLQPGVLVELPQTFADLPAGLYVAALLAPASANILNAGAVWHDPAQQHGTAAAGAGPPPPGPPPGVLLGGDPAARPMVVVARRLAATARRLEIAEAGTPLAWRPLELGDGEELVLAGGDVLRRGGDRVELLRGASGLALLLFGDESPVLALGVPGGCCDLAPAGPGGRERFVRFADASQLEVDGATWSADGRRPAAGAQKE